MGEGGGSGSGVGFRVQGFRGLGICQDKICGCVKHSSCSLQGCGAIVLLWRCFGRLFGRSGPPLRKRDTATWSESCGGLGGFSLGEGLEFVLSFVVHVVVMPLLLGRGEGGKVHGSSVSSLIASQLDDLLLFSPLVLGFTVGSFLA